MEIMVGQNGIIMYLHMLQHKTGDIRKLHKYNKAVNTLSMKASVNLYKHKALQLSARCNAKLEW